MDNPEEASRDAVKLFRLPLIFALIWERGDRRALGPRMIFSGIELRGKGELAELVAELTAAAGVVLLALLGVLLLISGDAILDRGDDPVAGCAGDIVT